MTTQDHSTFYVHDEKIKFAPDEFMKAQIACDFIVELTRAISRSGYYDPAHPSAREVKEGLYASFQRALCGAPEIMLTCRETDAAQDIYIVGVLDEPAGMRRLVKTSVAIIFIPKLREYFERKALLSVAIKKHITPAQFESFVTIMSEPVADCSDETAVGKHLTQALVNADIRDVSLVFKHDLGFAEGKLPWRVVITLRRLAKDLSVIPMFRDATPGEIKRVKSQIIGDILRPLRHPDLLRDLIINCDVITGSLAHIEFDELVQMVIDALSAAMLLPVADLVLEEYEREIHSPRDASGRRRETVGIILRYASERMLSAYMPGTSDLLERLYAHRLVRFESLPEELRLRITAKSMAREVVAHTDECVRTIRETTSVFDMERFVNLFRRVIPELIRQEEWQVIDAIVKVFSDVSSRTIFASGASGLPPSLADAVVDGAEDALTDAYLEAGLEGRRTINDILTKLGPPCVTVLDAVFARCEKPEIWKSAIDVLCGKGEPARNWALDVLGGEKSGTAAASAALIVIGYVGRVPDIAGIRKYLKHDNPGMRVRALDAVARLNRKEAEPLVIDALRDESEKVWNHALASLAAVSPLSEVSVLRLIEFINEELAVEHSDASRAHYLTRLVKAVGALADAPRRELLEETLLLMTAALLKERRGLLALFRGGPDKGSLEIIQAGISSLGRIGGEKSLSFLKSLACGNSPVADVAGEAVRKLGHTFA